MSTIFVSGTGNVYDWAVDGTVTVKAANRPYTTRILLRRPSDPNRFSGTVITEILHSAIGFDNNFMWGFADDYVMSHGDAYVGITVSGNTIGADGVANSGSLSGSGLKLQTIGGGADSWNVTSNQIRGYNNHGVEVLAGEELEVDYIEVEEQEAACTAPR